MFFGFADTFVLLPKDLGMFGFVQDFNIGALGSNISYFKTAGISFRWFVNGTSVIANG